MFLNQIIRMNIELIILKILVPSGFLKNSFVSYVSFSRNEIPYEELKNYKESLNVISNVFWCIKDYILNKNPKYIALNSSSAKLNRIYSYFIQKNNYNCEFGFKMSISNNLTNIITFAIITNMLKRTFI